MLRRTNFGKIFPAFLLTANFLLGWSVCVVSCGEAAEHRGHGSIIESQGHDESCLTSDESEDACALTASDAILQERQTVETTTEAAKFHRASVPVETRVRLNLRPETNQNSPPESSSIPIFVRLCNFRI
jgi:hypothetical protein